MPVRLTNNARSLLAVSIGANETQVRVRVGHGARFPTLGSEEWFPLVIEDDQGNVEITRCTGRAGDVLTVRRAQDDTKARAFGAGALVSLRLTAPAVRTIFGLENDDPAPIEDPDLDAPRGLIFNGLIVNAYHDEEGRQGYFHPYSGTSEGQYVFIGACYEAARVINDYLIELGTPVPLTLTGNLPNAVASEAYEGRLQIGGAIGYVSVEKTGGDELPPGYALEVDQETQEVVLTWPPFTDIDVGDVYNGDFENGIDGWDLGAGWSIVPSAGEGQGFGSYVAKQEGYIISRLESTDYVPCPPVGVTFPVQVNVQQGASRAGTAGAGVGVSFYGPAPEYTHIDTQKGMQVWSGSGGQWSLSRLPKATVPEGAAYMRAFVEGGHIYGSGPNPLWVDDVSWIVPPFVGEQLKDSYEIELTITDAEGRTASWSGTITTMETFTSFSWANGSGIALAIGNRNGPVARNPATGYLVYGGSDANTTFFHGPDINSFQAATLPATGAMFAWSRELGSFIFVAPGGAGGVWTWDETSGVFTKIVNSWGASGCHVNSYAEIPGVGVALAGNGMSWCGRSIMDLVSVTFSNQPYQRKVVVAGSKIVLCSGGLSSVRLYHAVIPAVGAPGWSAALVTIPHEGRGSGMAYSNGMDLILVSTTTGGLWAATPDLAEAEQVNPDNYQVSTDSDAMIYVPQWRATFAFRYQQVNPSVVYWQDGSLGTTRQPVSFDNEPQADGSGSLFYDPASDTLLGINGATPKRGTVSYEVIEE